MKTTHKINKVITGFLLVCFVIWIALMMLAFLYQGLIVLKTYL